MMVDCDIIVVVFGLCVLGVVWIVVVGIFRLVFFFVIIVVIVVFFIVWIVFFLEVFFGCLGFFVFGEGVEIFC